VIIAATLSSAQMGLFAYVFVMRWDLSCVGLLQMIVSTVTVVLIGAVVCEEKLTLTHIFGAGTALTGDMLMSL
jgi:hypothetical protein